MKIAYKEIKFHDKSLLLIDRVNRIIGEYKAKGYSLTLRQVYYQLVARDIIQNNEKSYKNLGNLISDGRLAGLIDWHAIEDRTRNLKGNSHWESPGDIISASAHSLRYDKWEDMDHYVEVWVEKDALVGVVGKACGSLDVNFFSCRGYVSQSEMWSAAQRLNQKLEYGREPVIIHLGDHDPSGLDMSRDIQERLQLFEVEPIFKRIALNMDQIDKYGPPPNPAKLTDSRVHGYMARFGSKSWELDALPPEVIEALIAEAVEPYIDRDRFSEVVEREETDKDMLQRVSRDWEAVEAHYREHDTFGNDPDDGDNGPEPDYHI